jgi:predicted transcriptional regulator
MHDGEQEDWDSPEDQPVYDKQHVEIQKLFAEMEMKAKNAMNYLVLEGFVDPTDEPGVYKYTPEGLVLAQQQYKKLREDGLM